MTRRLRFFLLGFALSLAPAAAATVPRPSPEFAIRMPDGRQLLLSSFKGKVIVLEFLFTT